MSSYETITGIKCCHQFIHLSYTRPFCGGPHWVYQTHILQAALYHIRSNGTVPQTDFFCWHSSAELKTPRESLQYRLFLLARTRSLKSLALASITARSRNGGDTDERREVRPAAADQVTRALSPHSTASSFGPTPLRADDMLVDWKGESFGGLDTRRSELMTSMFFPSRSWFSNIILFKIEKSYYTDHLSIRLINWSEAKLGTIRGV